MDRKKGDKKKKPEKDKKDDRQKEKQTTAQRIGGLFHKFAHFRFSTRAKSDSKVLPPKTQVKSDNNSALLGSSTSASSDSYATPTRFRTRTDLGVSESESSLVYSPTGQRYATRADYIHIPLRGPGGSAQELQQNSPGQTPKQAPRHSVSQRSKLSSNNNLEDFLGSLLLDSAGDLAARECVSGKPPLPSSKQPPPRVIGLSMKSCNQPNEQFDDYPHISTRNIDPVRQKPPRQHHRSHAASKEGLAPSGVVSANQPEKQAAATSKTTAVVSSEATSSSTPMGLIETDLDTEVTIITSGVNGKTRSLMNLGATETKSALRGLLAPHHHKHRDPSKDDDTDGSADLTDKHQHRPHKSMEFLLDKQNLPIVEPPENNLQKNGATGNVMLSEHELRVQRSYNRINVPDWFKRFQQQRPSSEFLILPRKSYTANSTSALHSAHHRERWPPTPTSSATLPSNGQRTASFNSLANTTQITPQREDDQQQFVRWSKTAAKTGGSAASSPCQSTRSSFNLPRYPYTVGGATSPSSLRSSFNGRTPYMGWRSQEKLNRSPRTPAERLANSILMAQESSNDDEMVAAAATEDIIEVTTAIDQFVHDSGLVVPGTDDVTSSGGASSQETVKLRSRSVSPATALEHQQHSQRKCWMESSFVGTKPLDSPQTPLTLSEEQQQQTQNNGELNKTQIQQQQRQERTVHHRTQMLECP